MTDRELLENAAKAAGMTGYRYSAVFGMDKLLDPSRQDGGTIGRGWNPLTDANDALRLAAEARLDIEIGLCYCEATAFDLVKSETHRFTEDWGAGPTLLDVRIQKICRAIVRAAAALGAAQ